MSLTANFSIKMLAYYELSDDLLTFDERGNKTKIWPKIPETTTSQVRIKWLTHFSDSVEFAFVAICSRLTQYCW